MFGYFIPKNAADSSALRKHLVAASGEFVGTFLFLFTAYLGHAMSVQSATELAPDGQNSNETVVCIALSYGFSLLVAAWVLYRVSGGLFNPAITLGMVLTGTLPPWRGLVLFPTQIISAICAAAVVAALTPIDMAIVQTRLAPDINIAQGLFLEMVRYFKHLAKPLPKLFALTYHLPTVPHLLFDVHNSHARGRKI